MIDLWLAALIWLLTQAFTVLVCSLCSASAQDEAYREGVEDGRRAAQVDRLVDMATSL